MSDVPKGWTKANLSDLVGLKTGPFGSSLHQSDYVTDGVPLVNPMHIVQGRIRPSADITVTPETVARLQEFCLYEGDVVLARRGEMGRCAVVRRSESGWMCGTGSLIVRPDSRLLDANYLQGLLSSSASVKYLLEASVGSTMANLNQQHLLSMDIALPPLPEQLRIVGKLDEVLSVLDAGEAELKAAQKKLTQYRQSLLKAAVEGALTASWREQQRAQHPPAESGAQLLQRILTERRARWEAKQLAKFEAQGKAAPKDWQKKYPEPVQPDTTDLPALPQGWVWASVDALLDDIETGKSFKCDERPPVGDEVGVIKVSAVSWGEFDEQESKTCLDPSFIKPELFVQQGDFLFSRANTIELVGACVIAEHVSKQVMLSDKTLRFVFVDPFVKSWLQSVLRSQHGRKQIETLASGNQDSMRNIGQERIRQIAIPLPPASEMLYCTELLAAGLSSASSQAEALSHSMKQSTAQRQNILRAAFSGQLVPQDPSDEPAAELLARICAERAAQASARKPRGRQKEAA